MDMTRLQRSCGSGFDQTGNSIKSFYLLLVLAAENNHCKCKETFEVFMTEFESMIFKEESILHDSASNLTQDDADLDCRGK